MRSRKLLLGVAVLGLLAIVAVVTLLSGQEQFAGVAVVLMVFAVGVLVLDGATTLRRVERQQQRLVKTMRAAAEQTSGKTSATMPVATAPLTSEADLIGTIRLLQAQYVGRLDRAEAKLDRAVERLTDVRRE